MSNRQCSRRSGGGAPDAPGATMQGDDSRFFADSRTVALGAGRWAASETVGLKASLAARAESHGEGLGWCGNSPSLARWQGAAPAATLSEAAPTWHARAAPAVWQSSRNAAVNSATTARVDRPGFMRCMLSRGRAAQQTD